MLVPRYSSAGITAVCVQQDVRGCMLSLSQVSVVLGFPLFKCCPPSRGAIDPSPGRPFHAPRSPSRSSEPVLSPARHRAAVWDGRSATARPREAKWRSRLAAVSWVCSNPNIFKYPNYYDVTSLSYFFLCAISKGPYDCTDR